MAQIDIKSLRISKGLTLKDVAKYVGVSEATVCRWESGNIRNMRRDRIYLLAKILEIPPSSLCEADDYEPDPPTPAMSEVKKRLHALIDLMPEDKAESLLLFLEH